MVTEQRKQDKKISVQHHELKTHETRFGYSKGEKIGIYYYCVCGDWAGKVDHLHYSAVYESFLGDHLGQTV